MQTNSEQQSTEEKPKQKYFDERKPFAEIERDNEKFKNYYKASRKTHRLQLYNDGRFQTQNILSEEEFEEFYEYIKTILPTTFRITGSRT